MLSLVEEEEMAEYGVSTLSEGFSRKGMRHVGHFMKGGWRYYRKHGWKWL